MTELGQLYVSAAKLALVTINAILYSLGGRDEYPKAVRRFLGSSILILGIIGILALVDRFNWVFCISLILLPIAYSFGYGGDTLKEKVIRRTKFLRRLPLQAYHLCYIQA